MEEPAPQPPVDTVVETKSPQLQTEPVDKKNLPPVPVFIPEMKKTEEPPPIPVPWLETISLFYVILFACFGLHFLSHIIVSLPLLFQC